MKTPIYTKDHKICGVSNYFSHGNDCKYTVSEGYIPKIITIKDLTYVCTNQTLRFEKRCQQLTNAPPDTEIVEVTGLQKIHLPPSCKLFGRNYSITPTYEIQSLRRNDVEEYKIEHEIIDSNLPSSIRIYKERHQAYENQINFDVLDKEVNLTPLYVLVALMV